MLGCKGLACSSIKVLQKENIPSFRNSFLLLEEKVPPSIPPSLHPSVDPPCSPTGRSHTYFSFLSLNSQSLPKNPKLNVRMHVQTVSPHLVFWEIIGPFGNKTTWPSQGWRVGPENWSSLYSCLETWLPVLLWTSCLLLHCCYTPLSYINFFP